MARRSAVALLACLSLVVMSAAPAMASDATIATRLVITAADVGSGYTSAPAGARPVVSPKIAECVGISVAKRKVSATFNGPDLINRADGSTIQSSVDIVQTAAMAKQDVRVMKSAKFTKCTEQVISDLLKSQGITVVYVTPNPLLSRKKLGTFTGAFDLQLKLADGSLQHSLEVGFVRGRAEVDATLSSSGGSADVATLSAALGKVAKRLKNAAV